MSDLQFAAADPAIYSAQAHKMLDQAGVPPKYRRFDHSFVQKMAAGMSQTSNGDAPKDN